jgi:hypothetical protein
MIPTMAETLNYLGLRKKSYQSVFGPAGAAGSEAMKDLAKFCFAFDTCSSPDLHLTLLKSARRDVWLRIQQHLHLQPDELAALYKAVAAGE